MHYCLFSALNAEHSQAVAPDEQSESTTELHESSALALLKHVSCWNILTYLQSLKSSIDPRFGVLS